MSLSAILNSPLLYALVGGGILIVLAIAAVFFLRGRKRALELGVSKEDFNSAMRGCVAFSIVPSIAVIIGLVLPGPSAGRSLALVPPVCGGFSPIRTDGGRSGRHGRRL